MDTIIIKITDIAIDCIIGVTEEERSKKQTIFASVELVVDAKKTAETDSIEDTVNYKNIYTEIIKKVSESKFNLLERLAKEIVSVCFSFDRVLKVKATVTKPNRLPKAKGVSVTIEGISPDVRA